MPLINVQDVPKPIMRKLNAEAKKRQVGVSTVVTDSLIGALNLNEPKHAPSRYGGGATSSGLVVDVPESARKRLRMDAAENGSTLRAGVINALADRYSLPRVPDERRPK